MMAVRDRIGRPRYLLIKVEVMGRGVAGSLITREDKVNEGNKNKENNGGEAGKGEAPTGCGDGYGYGYGYMGGMVGARKADTLQKSDIISIIRELYRKSSIDFSPPSKGAPMGEGYQFSVPDSLRLPYIVLTESNLAILKTGHRYIHEARRILNTETVYKGVRYRITTLKASGCITKLKDAISLLKKGLFKEGSEDEGRSPSS